jgi:hypothetical protein
VSELHTDYLVVGAGAMGMAFTDVLLTETDAKIVLVDRNHQPGGHWNKAYPYVRLHQPSAFYGVNSKDLGADTIDETGWNAGLYELATNGEVCAYFDAVMQRQFLPSGRVEYFPMSEYLGAGKIRSLVSGAETLVKASKTVDATYMNVTVPSMRDPLYDVAEGVHCVPPNGLPEVTGQFDRYVVVGAGKTGMDACLFLLKHAVMPEQISWIMPRDSWMLDRARIQPGPSFAEKNAKGFALQLKAIAEANSVEELLTNVAEAGGLLRFDENVWPTMYRCATVTAAELEQLRQIEDIVRLGHVQAIEPERIVLDGGEVATSPTTLHVDCTADGLERRPAVPVFDAAAITLQAVRTCQQVFSAAFIGHVEAAYEDESTKNELCTPVPHPDSEVDFLRSNLANNLNARRWGQDAELQEWLKDARLDGFARRAAQPLSAQTSAEVKALSGEYAAASVANLQRLLAAVDG